MSASSESSSVRDHLKIHPGPVIDYRQKLQSAAVRGASHAFRARVEPRQTKAPHSSTNGAQAAAASAGQASRQKCVSAPKTFAAALTPSIQSPSLPTSQVQQLVKGFEQSSASYMLLNSSGIHRPSESSLSRSHSQVAARIASISSLSPPKAPLPLPNRDRQNKTFSGVEAPFSSHGENDLGSEIHSTSAEVTQSPIQERNITARGPVRPVSNAHTLPIVAAWKQDHNTGNGTTTANLQEHKPQDASSTLAAQVAIRNLVPLNMSSVPDPTPGDQKAATSSKWAPLDGLEHRHRSNERRSIGQTESNPRNTLKPSISNEPRSATSKDESDGERSTRSVSRPIAYLRTTSWQSKHRYPSSSDPHYVDERTGLTEVSLADAIVASSLASSRASSTAKLFPVPAPAPLRRLSGSRSLFRHRHSSDTEISRLVGTQKGIRQTLRRYPSDDTTDESIRGKYKHFMKHPNKHGEGSRNRWEGELTERERKRYEGVWAANKGIFLTTAFSRAKGEVTFETPTTELVLDLVVRDIWSRSRLPTDTLAEIWDLVDYHGVNILTRDEFVLGLWLIDQRLRGHKLPIRVSPTLWASVRHAWGVKVPR